MGKFEMVVTMVIVALIQASDQASPSLHPSSSEDIYPFPSHPFSLSRNEDFDLIHSKEHTTASSNYGNENWAEWLNHPFAQNLCHRDHKTRPKQFKHSPSDAVYNCVVSCLDHMKNKNEEDGNVGACFSNCKNY